MGTRANHLQGTLVRPILETLVLSALHGLCSSSRLRQRTREAGHL